MPISIFSLQGSKPEAERSEELKEALKSFELNNRDMGMSLSTLEEENQRLSENLNDQKLKASSKMDDMVENQGKLTRDNAKLERRAEAAEK